MLQEQRQAEALNARGTEAFKRGDYAEAMRYYQEALKHSPNDPTIRANLKYVTEKDAVLRSQDAHASDAFKRLGSEADDASTAQQFDSLSAVVGRGPFGSHQVVARVRQRSADGTVEKCDQGDPGCQALSMSHHAELAKDSSADEQAKAESNIGFDTATDQQGELAMPSRVSALAKIIPHAAWPDKQVRRSYDHYKRLEVRKAKTEARIAEYKRREAAGDGDPAAWDVKLAALNRALTKNESAQQEVLKQIKHRITVDLGLTLQEAPASPEEK